MQYDGRFRFRSIPAKRFYDAPLIIYIAIMLGVIIVQGCLMLNGQPGLRALLSDGDLRRIARVGTVSASFD